MQEQNFEKQVREKMEELSFVPSEPVWQKVEEQIRKKKDRRRVLFWLLPFLLLTGGVFVWTSKKEFFNDRQTTQTVPAAEPDRTAPVENEPSVAFEEKNRIKTQEEEVLLNRDNSIIAPSAPIDEPLPLSTNAANTKKKIIPAQTIAVDKNTKESDQKQDVSQSVPPVEDETRSAIAPVPSESEKGLNSKTTSSEDATTTIKNGAIAENNDNTKDSSSTENQPVSQDSTAVHADTTIFKIAASKKKRDLKFRPRAAAGVSGLASSAFKFLPVASSGVNSNAERLFDQSFSAPNTNNGPTPTNAIAFHTPEVYSGFSFSAGADIVKPVSERLNLVGGLGYSYYSTRVYIGSKVNAATTLNRVNEEVKVNDYFLATGIQKEAYTNQYHFIDLPLGVEWKVFKKLPLQLHSGFIVSQLVATNALYYSNLQNIYYEDDKVFKKTQLSLFTDLSYRLLKFKKGSLHAGPQVQLGLSNLMKKEAYGKQHLFFAGLNAHFDF